MAVAPLPRSVRRTDVRGWPVSALPREHANEMFVIGSARILGALDPCRSPDCECQLQTVFRGELHGVGSGSEPSQRERKAAGGGKVVGTTCEEDRSLGMSGTWRRGSNQYLSCRERCTMRLNARHFGLSSAVLAAGTFVMCAFVMAFAPTAMQSRCRPCCM